MIKTARYLLKLCGISVPLVLVVAGLFPTLVFADPPLRFYHLGGISSFNKEIVSIRENKFHNLVEQRFDFSCGAAAVTTIP